jgi:hypothetical protein
MKDAISSPPARTISGLLHVLYAHIKDAVLLLTILPTCIRSALFYPKRQLSHQLKDQTAAKASSYNPLLYLTTIHSLLKIRLFLPRLLRHHSQHNMMTLTTLKTLATPLALSASAAHLERDAQRLAANIRAVDGVVPADVDCIRETVMRYRSAVWNRAPISRGFVTGIGIEKAEEMSERLRLPSPISPGDSVNGIGDDNGAKHGAETKMETDSAASAASGSQAERSNHAVSGPKDGFVRYNTLTGGRHNEGVAKML